MSGGDAGDVIGRLSESIARKTGIGEIPVIAVAGHDTASAVAAVPASSPNFAYLSSGTWSLMGIEVEKPIINEVSFKNNFTNEGGIEGTTRFLKNITGMWILERCREQWKRSGLDYSYDDMVRMAELSEFTSLINPDDPRFANPENMLREITAYCEETGQLFPLRTPIMYIVYFIAWRIVIKSCWKYSNRCRHIRSNDCM